MFRVCHQPLILKVLQRRVGIQERGMMESSPMMIMFLVHHHLAVLPRKSNKKVLPLGYKVPQTQQICLISMLLLGPSIKLENKSGNRTENIESSMIHLLCFFVNFLL